MFDILILETNCPSLCNIPLIQRFLEGAKSKGRNERILRANKSIHLEFVMQQQPPGT
jgi:hypothetical protein